MVKNGNHPKPGSIIRVEPIRSERDIKSIKRLLQDRPRDLAIFCLGINTNLRASDIVKITVGHLRGLQPGEHFTIKEQKTGKQRKITLNKTVFDTVQPLLNAERPDSEPIFVSAKTKKGLLPGTLNLLVKSWCKDINIRTNMGSHSLRKTFGYSRQSSIMV